MQQNSPLARLGLDDSADAGAIRRAYARELKQIDQQSDAAGFQLLRDAYEKAMAWANRKSVGGSGASTVVAAMPEAQAPPAPPGAPVHPQDEAPHRDGQRTAPPPPTASARDAGAGEIPLRLAQAVFEEFQAAGAKLVAQRYKRDATQWREQLKHCLDDERMLNLGARAHFEFLIGRLLADGWQAGHECLFVAGCSNSAS